MSIDICGNPYTIQKQQQNQDPTIGLLKTIPGVGNLIAYLLQAEIGDIHRFSSAKKLCSYAGIVPNTHQSAEKEYHGSITRLGNRYIRSAIVEAAQKAKTADPALYAFYNKIERKVGKQKATVAVARKRLVAVYHIWKEGKPYQPDSLTKIHLGKPVSLSGHNR